MLLAANSLEGLFFGMFLMGGLVFLGFASFQGFLEHQAGKRSKDPRLRRRWLEAQIEDLYEKLYWLEKSLETTRKEEPPVLLPDRKKPDQKGKSIEVEFKRTIEVHPQSNGSVVP